MNQTELADQIQRAAQKHAFEQRAQLPRHACPTTRQADAVERQFQAAYLSGVMQMATFLAGRDGQEGVTAPAIMSAASLAGKRLGFAEESGKGEPRAEGS